MTARLRDEAIEMFARTLLRRYGVVFRRLLEREAFSVSWFELGRVYRRLEARGEIRGGHFVSGVSGEQFALPEAIGLLRSVRRAAAKRELITISGADKQMVGEFTAVVRKVRPPEPYNAKGIKYGEAKDHPSEQIKRKAGKAFGSGEK